MVVLDTLDVVASVQRAGDPEGYMQFRVGSQDWWRHSWQRPRGNICLWWFGRDAMDALGYGSACMGRHGPPLSAASRALARAVKQSKTLP